MYQPVFRSPLFHLVFSCILFMNMLACSSSEESVSKPSLLIEYIGHASFKLSMADQSILLDPFADHVWIGYDFPKDITANAIFSTHPHYDHDGGIFRGLHPYWEGQMPIHQDPGNYQIGEFKIKGIKGKHCDPYGKEFGQKNTIWIMEVAGLRLAHWGDNGPITDSLANLLKDIDILMIPIDDEEHILKNEELAEVLEKVNPTVIIPMHYKLAELEREEGKPQFLGTLDDFLKDKTNIKHLEANSFAFSKDNLPESPQFWIFQHSPALRPAGEVKSVVMPQKQ